MIKCVRCMCNCCSKYRCPYRVSRCNTCHANEFNINFDCDFWESEKTAPKRLKIARKGKHGNDMINTKLDFIITQMGLCAPVIDHNGTFDVVWKDIPIARFYSKREANEYVERLQGGFREKLVVRTVKLLK